MRRRRNAPQAPRAPNPFRLTRPCSDCPFRSDIPPYLRKDRVQEIQRDLVQAEFHCHRTTAHDDNDEPVVAGREAHCAGALILLEKIERPSQMMRIAERIGLYDPSKLDMQAPVFADWETMHAAQEPDRKRRGTGEPCAVVDADCEHPAGWADGTSNLEANAPFSCWSCGEPVCAACSREEKKKYRKIRLCNDCIDQIEQDQQDEREVRA